MYGERHYHPRSLNDPRRATVTIVLLIDEKDDGKIDFKRLLDLVQGGLDAFFVPSNTGSLLCCP